MTRLDEQGYAPHLGVTDWIRNELALGYCAAIGLPMDLADGRPWVRTHDEAHDPILWSVGGRCAHEACDPDGSARAAYGSQLRGILDMPGVVEDPS